MKPCQDNLSSKLMNPRYGFGSMHYSAKTSKQVTESFNSLPIQFKNTHKLDIPRKAYESTESGKSVDKIVVGVYWVVSEV